MNKQFAKQAQMSAFLKCDSYLSSSNKRQATYEDPQGRFNGFWTYKGVLHPSRLIHVSSAWSSHERALGKHKVLTLNWPSNWPSLNMNFWLVVVVFLFFHKAKRSWETVQLKCLVGLFRDFKFSHHGGRGNDNTRTTQTKLLSKMSCGMSIDFVKLLPRSKVRWETKFPVHVNYSLV